MIYLAKPTMLDLLKLCSDARPDEIEQYQELTGNEWLMDEVANEHYNRQGTKFVLLDGDYPIVAGGWDLLIDGVWQSWMVGTMSNWGTHWRSITKYTRRTMDAMFEDGARRLQTCATAKRTEACEWYRRGLLMQREGVFRGWGVNGEDMVMYARVKNNG